MFAEGSTPANTQVKVLGVLGMVDSDEADWKVIAIRSTDPAAEVVHGACSSVLALSVSR